MPKDRSSGATAYAARGAHISELEALTHLYEVGNRCVRAGNDIEGCLGGILDAAIRVTAAVIPRVAARRGRARGAIDTAHQQ